MSSNDEAAKIRKEIDNVNIRDVLLFLFLCPYIFLSTTFKSFLSLLQQVLKVAHSKQYSTYGKIKTQIPVRPTMISTSSRFKIVLKSARS